MTREAIKAGARPSLSARIKSSGTLGPRAAAPQLKRGEVLSWPSWR